MEDQAEDSLERTRHRSKVRVLIPSVCALAVLLTYVRLYFGVDLGDEPFQIVVPYRYDLGARPFVDEVNIGQVGAGLLAYPFLAAYHQVVGLDGIVLFSRHVYFLFAVGVTAAIFFSLRTLLRSALVAFPLSLLFIAFIPFNEPVLSYNTLGNGLFTAGCFLGLAFTRNRSRPYLLLAGLTHGLAVFSYPTLALPVATYAAVLYFLSGRSRSALIWYAAVAVLPCIGYLAVLLNDGIANARDVLGLARTVAEERDHGADRAINIVRDTAGGFPLAPLALAAFVSAMAVARRRPKLSVALLVLLPLLALPVRPRDLTDSAASIHYVANIGLLAVPFFLALRTHGLCRQLMVGVWVPAFVAGWAISWSTFKAADHQGLGFFPAAIVAVVLLALVVRGVCHQTAASRSAPTAPLLVPLVALAALVGLQFTSSIHDLSPVRLHSRIESGPYAGVITNPQTKKLLTQLSSDLNRTTNGRCRILFYYGLPAGYLLTANRPFTNTAFLSSNKVIMTVYGRRLVNYYRSRGLPDVAVRLTRIPHMHHGGRVGYLPGDPLDTLIRGPAYGRVTTTSEYTIYGRRGALCTRA